MLEDPFGEEEKHERWKIRSVVLKVLVILLGLALAAAYHYSQAAPRAMNGQECSNFSDIALVARALAEEKVPAKTAEKAMRRVYDVSSERGETIFLRIIKTAYEADASALDFSMLLLRTCVQNGGNMDGVLGVDS